MMKKFRAWNSCFYYSRSQKDWSVYILFCWCYQPIHMCSSCCASGKLILRLKAEFLKEEPHYLSFPLFCVIPVASYNFICHGRKPHWVLIKFPIQSFKHIGDGIFTFLSPVFKVWVEETCESIAVSVNPWPKRASGRCPSVPDRHIQATFLLHLSSDWVRMTS